MDKTPLADLTYRGYEGGLNPLHSRWRVIARHTYRRAFKNKWFWWLTILSGMHYLLLAATAYFIDNMADSLGGGERFKTQFFASLVWRDQFLHGFALGHFMLMAIVLIVGSGVIANDNQSRALLVYLSKPCSKVDYLVGKLAGVFVPIFTAMGIPALFFFIYGILNYREHGFITEDPLLFIQLPIILAIVSAFQASLIVGCSALFNNGRVAGATYAGAYVLTGLFAMLTGGLSQIRGLPAAMETLLSRLHYLSLYGVIEGVYKVILNTDGTRTFGGRAAETVFAKPPLILLLPILLIPMGLAIFVAWRKIRAVEVVQ